MPITNSSTANGGTGTANVWRIWTSATTSVTSNTVVDPWTIWTSGTGTTISTSASNTALWYTWVRQTYPLADGLDRPLPAVVAPPRPAIAAPHRRPAAPPVDQETLAQQAAKTREASARAKKLLLECLSPAQRDQLEKFDYFDVELPNGHAYRIHRGRSHNVRPLVNGQEADLTLCAHPGPWVPDYDNALAQKLMLEHDERGFLRLANRGGGRVAEQAVPWLAEAPRPN